VAGGCDARVGGSSVHLPGPPACVDSFIACYLHVDSGFAHRLKHSNLVWILIPLTALWTNLHGGFRSLIAAPAWLPSEARLAAFGRMLPLRSLEPRVSLLPAFSIRMEFSFIYM